jgi:hypothetical protein
MHISEQQARQRILNAHGLGRQRYASPVDAMRALVAVQTQYPASLAPALAARSNGVTLKWVESAIAKKRIFLKGWNLRATLHTSLAQDHMMMLAAVQRPRLASFKRWMNAYGVDNDRMDQLHTAILEALASGPLARREIHEKVDFYKGLPMVGWGLDAMGLAFEGKIVLSHQAAANTAFVRLDHWLPELSSSELTEEEALKELMRRYFATYGPASYADFLYWSGVKTGHANKAFQAARGELEEVTLESRKGAFFTFGSPPLEGSGMPLRLLPKFDVLMMGHKDKTLFLPEKLKPMVFRKAGQVEAVVLADGQVRGTWRTVRNGKVLEFTIEPYCKFKKAWEKQLPKEAERVAKALGFGELRIAGY